MFKKHFWFTASVLFHFLFSQAQSDFVQQKRNPPKPFTFRSINSISLLEGQQGSALQLQTVNGVQFKTWFAGIGVGIDYYRYRGVPLFLDVRKDLPIKKVPLYLYADAGIHFPWARRGRETFWSESDLTKGIYYDAGLGYRLAVAKRYALTFSGGYSVKEIGEIMKQPVACITFPCPEYNQRYDFTLRRLTLRAGWVF